MKDVESKIVTIRNERVILDCDVAALYGVPTKEINQAVRNNPEKFPAGYTFQTTNEEKNGNADDNKHYRYVCEN